MRHLHTLARAAGDGLAAAVAFVIQMDGVTEVRPNVETHPAFGAALEAARAAGVQVLALPAMWSRMRYGSRRGSPCGFEPCAFGEKPL